MFEKYDATLDELIRFGKLHTMAYYGKYKLI